MQPKTSEYLPKIRQKRVNRLDAETAARTSVSTAAREVAECAKDVSTPGPVRADQLEIGAAVER